MPEKLKWTRKDLLGLEELSREEIELVLDTAESFKEVGRRESDGRKHCARPGTRYASTTRLARGCCAG